MGTCASLSAAGVLCRVSLRAKTRKPLCNTDKCDINIQEVERGSRFCIQILWKIG